jgi:hypothetical protein
MWKKKIEQASRYHQKRLDVADTDSIFGRGNKKYAPLHTSSLKRTGFGFPVTHRSISDLKASRSTWKSPEKENISEKALAKGFSNFTMTPPCVNFSEGFSE